MRLSELNTDKALDVLCELTPYVSSIMEDDDILSALGDFMNWSVDEKKAAANGAEGNDASMSEKGIRMFGGMVRNIPLLLKTHRHDMYGILSVLNEKSAAEIAGQPVGETVRQIKDVFQDSELLDFFRSSVRQEQTEPSVPSASAPA